MDETEKLARWWNALNSWEWAEDMPGKPDGWNEFPDLVRDGEVFVPNKYDWSGGIMRSIEKRIGLKECLRWHHLHKMESTEAEFEEWWKNRDK